MKEEILKIVEQLKQDTITSDKAQKLLLDLFVVSCRYSEDDMRKALEWGMNIGEHSKVYTNKQFNELLDICN